MNVDLPISFRELRYEDLPFLREMFYVSLFSVKGENAFPRDIIDKPHLARYHQDWGKAGDYGIVVHNERENIGAIWVRFFSKENPGYGFVEAAAPEMGIALKKEFRGKGLGRKLIEQLCVDLKAKGTSALSLSTDSRNPAMHLYKSCGFEEVEREEYSVKMYKKLE